MNKQTNIQKIEKDLNFILPLWGEQKKSFSLLLALDGHHEYISDLQRHTDLFALMENKLLEIIILDTCKMFEFKPSYGISIPNLFAQAKKIFTDQYFEENKDDLWKNVTFSELSLILSKVDFKLEEIEKIIIKLKRLRNKLIAHYDGHIDTVEKAEIFYQNSNNNLSFSEYTEVFRVGDEVLKTIKLLIFGINMKITSNEHYEFDLERVAYALQQLNSNDHDESN